jgi:anti-sigma B factor antagonist
MMIQLINRETEGELLLDGRLDAVTSPEAEEVFLQMAQRFEKLTLNMAQLQYISSAGLRVLKKTYMAMVKKNGLLELNHVNKLVMEVLEMTGFSGLLKIV